MAFRIVRCQFDRDVKLIEGCTGNGVFLQTIDGDQGHGAIRQ